MFFAVELWTGIGWRRAIAFTASPEPSRSPVTTLRAMEIGLPTSPINASTRRPYSGINILVLWATADKRGYSSGLWATYKQWSDLGAQVRRGERSANVVFAQMIERETEVPNEGETPSKSRRFPFLREYHVFNVAQVDGYSEPQAEGPTEKRIEHADAFFSSVDMLVENGMNSAFYDPVADTVYMPPFESFPDRLMCYSILSHESIHWTGAEHRLKRSISGKFGSPEYAFEELIAELGAAFLRSFLGLPTDPRDHHAPETPALAAVGQAIAQFVSPLFEPTSPVRTWQPGGPWR